MRRNKKRNRTNKMDPVNYAESGASLVSTALSDLIHTLNSTEEDIEDNKDVLMGRSRQLAMGNALAISALKKFRTNVVGTGLKLKSTIDADILGISEEEAEKLEDKLESLWEYWAETTECDFEGQCNFYQLQSLSMLTKLRDGECFVALPFRRGPGEVFDLKIRILDSALCSSPTGTLKKIVNGIESDEQGVPVAYHFKKSYSSFDFVRISKFGSETGRRNILMLMEKERPGQKRGVPILAPVFEELHQITKVRRAELKNIAVSTIFTGFITSEGGSQHMATKSSLEKIVKEDGKEIKLGAGNIWALPPGQKLEFANPNRQCASLEVFISSVAKNIGACIEIPYEVLMSSFNSSYSASRASLNEAWRTYMLHREWHITEFCKPIYAEFLDYIVDKKIIELPGYRENLLMRRAYQSSEWFGNSAGQIDPLKEVKASVEKVRSGLSTLARESKILTGTDYEKTYKQRKREIKLEGELEKLKKEFRGGEGNVLVASGQKKGE
ncbi:phage portal protein [Cetobacterium sp. 2A]|uniref:phage portal protein n=1 Tax=Cetobacterium sp. 2A TaxID=2754723 RepID=UPI00163CA562|nr:phage portal protein [Cetobacterium sp. 2A]MBC2855371.1 phage portal protein [Cetobacterium sp. 2A]